MAQVELLVGEPKEGEAKKAILACNDYLRLGPGRSLAKLLNRYRNGSETPPARRLNTLKAWSTQFDWQLRATAYDAEIERQKNDAVQVVMREGLALTHERVIRLKRLALFLEEQVYGGGVLLRKVEAKATEEKEDSEQIQFSHHPYPNIWLRDVKQVGAGEFAERVDLVRFNAALIEQLRGALDDLAKETGGRRQRRDNLNIDLSKLSDDQLERLAAGEDLLDVILSSYGRSGDRTPAPAASQDFDQ